MRIGVTVTLMSLLAALLAACGNAPTPVDSPPAAAPAPSTAGPAIKPGGGLVAEPAGVEGTLAITIRWSAQIVTGVPAEGLTTWVYKRTAQLLCPVTSSAEAAASYFASEATAARRPHQASQCALNRDDLTDPATRA